MVTRGREESGAGLFLKWKRRMFAQVNVEKEPGKQQKSDKQERKMVACDKAPGKVGGTQL